MVDAVDTFPYVLKHEYWAGADTLAGSWSVYAGSTYALTGDIEGPGWRLRTTSSYGRYRYYKSLDEFDPDQTIQLRGQNVSSELLLGHHFQWHRLTLKAFAGVTSARSLFDPYDPDPPGSGTSYGGKAALETWVAVTDTHWLAGNFSWATDFKTYKVGLRGGLATLDQLDIGLEAQWQGSKAYKAGRVGGFATWKLGDVGITVGAGASGRLDVRASHYGRINLFLRY